MSKLSILTKGFLKENPVFVLVLGTCPTLAVTTTVKNGFFMGLATTFVLICSNVVISLLKKLIPDSVRLPSFIVIISTFVTVVSLILEAYFKDIYNALGIFLPLIVVNCIILGRAELFASRNSVGDSFLDGVGIGAGFVFALITIGAIREILGMGSFLGFALFGGAVPFSLMAMPSGGFFIFGIVLAVMSFLTKKPYTKAGCGDCSGCNGCNGKESMEVGE